jgi:hypothetical protein
LPSLIILVGLQNILVKTHFLLQISDLHVIAYILSHPMSSHVSEKLYSDSQIDHQVHLVLTTLTNTPASVGMLELTANVWSDVVLDACNMFVVQRSVVGDLDIALQDLLFELYTVSKG